MISMKNTLAGLALAAVTGLGLLGAAPAMAQDSTAATAPAAVEIKDMTLGAPDAKVTLIEYASYTCPHCANFHEAVFKPLKAEYIDTGKVQFVFREVYFDRYGLWAAMVARCGGEMKYFGVQSILFETAKEWAGSDDPAVVVGNLKKIGRTAGMEDAQLDACLKDGAAAQAMVTHYEEVMKEFDVQGTPTLIVNGTKHENMSYDELKAILDAELAK